MSNRIAVVGLGYVGLPLAAEFGKYFETIGYDINTLRIDELRKGQDHTREVSELQLRDAARLTFTSDSTVLSECTTYIITVPTPIDSHRRPDLRPLISATTTVGRLLSAGDTVVYESTVYPGCTEEECVPVLEAESGLVFNADFYCGYSPERINPGDKHHTLRTIKKIVAGSTPEVTERLGRLYSEVVDAGVHSASSIRVAEAAKVIENAQRDINIAFVNELSLIFSRIGIDTLEVLDAAATKWNFLRFTPGLVGGHCIGVDPYYLTHKAQELGYHPEILLAGRRLNDAMGKHVAGAVVKLLIKNRQTVAGARVLVLGITFKENCPDIRNSKVIDLIRELEDFECNVDIHDPWAATDEVQEEYGLTLVQPAESYEAIVVAVAHKEFHGFDVAGHLVSGGVVFDIKGILPRTMADARL